MIGDPLHVRAADERLETAAALGAPGRTRHVVRQFPRVFARELDHARDGGDELRIVVILVGPLFVRDLAAL